MAKTEKGTDYPKWPIAKIEEKATLNVNTKFIWPLTTWQICYLDHKEKSGVKKQKC